MAPSNLVYARLDRMRTQLNEMDMAYGCIWHMDAHGGSTKTTLHNSLQNGYLSESPAPGVGLTRVEMHGMHGMG